MKLRDIFLSWDFLAALAISVLLYVVLPENIKNSFASAVYGVGISVLSIIFSVYFAALAIIISSGDNEFIHFLEESGDYTTIISAFRFSLIFLFIALVSSILMFVITSVWNAENVEVQHKAWVSVFAFLFGYSLFVTANSSLDAIRYAERRVTFIRKMRDIEKHKRESDSRRYKP